MTQHVVCGVWRVVCGVCGLSRVACVVSASTIVAQTEVRCGITGLHRTRSDVRREARGTDASGVVVELVHVVLRLTYLDARSGLSRHEDQDLG